MPIVEKISSTVRHPGFFNVLLSFFGSFSIGSLIPPNGNQYVYFVPLYKDIYPNLHNDWYANTTDSNVAFTILIKFIYHVLSLSEIGIFSCWNFILVLIINTLNIYTLFKIVQILNTKKLLNDFEIVTLIVVSLTLTFPDAKSGVAGLYFIQPLLQPSTFGIFFLMGIHSTLCLLTMPIHRKHNLIKANIFFLLGLIFHPSLLVSFMILATTLVAICFVWKEKYSGLFQLEIFSAVVAVLLLVILNPQTLRIFIPNKQIQEALKFFAEIRIPYHVIPGVWFSSAELLRISIILLSCFLVLRWFKRTEITTFYFLVSISIPASAIFVELTKNTSLELAMPWRISVFLYPLAVIITLLATLEYELQQEKLSKLMSFLIIIIILLSALNMKKVALFFILLIFIKRIRKFDAHKYFAPIICLAITLAVAKGGFENTARAYQREPVLINETFLDNPALKGVGLTPVGSDELRLDHGLSIYINSQAAPNASSAIVEWRRRIIKATKVYDKFERICNSNIKQQVQWIVIPNNQLIPSCLGNVRVINGKSWKVVILNAK